MHQFNRLVLRKGVCHQTYEHKRSIYHQLVLTEEYRTQILVWSSRETAYIGSCKKTALLEHDVPGCNQLGKYAIGARKTKSPYTDPHVKLGSIITNNHMDLLC